MPVIAPEADILALLHLLAHQCSDGTTILGRLIARAETPSVRVEARGALYSLKDGPQSPRLPLASDRAILVDRGR